MTRKQNILHSVVVDDLVIGVESQITLNKFLLTPSIDIQFNATPTRQRRVVKSIKNGVCSGFNSLPVFVITFALLQGTIFKCLKRAAERMMHL